MSDLLDGTFSPDDAKQAIIHYSGIVEKYRTQSGAKPDADFMAVTLEYCINLELKRKAYSGTMIGGNLNDRVDWVRQVMLEGVMSKTKKTEKHIFLAKRVNEDYIPRFLIEDDRPLLDQEITISVHFAVLALVSMASSDFVPEERSDIFMKLQSLMHRGYGFSKKSLGEDEATIYTIALTEMIYDMDQKAINPDDQIDH